MRKILLPLILAGITLFATACGENEEYGLCFISSEGTADINGDRFYPMHSIVKFPQALYVSDYMQTNGVSLDSMVVIRKAELMQDTWSPMLKVMEEEGAFSFRELLRLSLIESDNNACDLLFQLFGMPEKVESFVEGLGFKNIKIMYTERQMHDCPSLALENCCTPSEMARLLLWFNGHKDDNAYIREVWNLMAACNTGADRLPAAFGDGCRVVHKTGTGFAPENGMPQMNDAGIVIFPDGQVIAIAVFVPHPNSPNELAEIVKTSLE